MYTQSITRAHPTAFILLIDASGSMSEPIRFHGRSMTKAEAVAAVTNELLFELIERARREDGVRPYYDIAVLGYGGDNEVRSMLPGGQELVQGAEQVFQVQVEQADKVVDAHQQGEEGEDQEVGQSGR